MINKNDPHMPPGVTNGEVKTAKTAPTFNQDLMPGVTNGEEKIDATTAADRKIQKERAAFDKAAQKKIAENEAEQKEMERTALHEAVHKYWGRETLYPYEFGETIRYANPQNVTDTNSGFKITTYEGSDIHWTSSFAGQAFDAVYKEKRDDTFTAHDAETIISLTQLRGWSQLNFTGTREEQETLWLAVMKRNRQNERAFRQGKLLGPDGVPVTEFQPIIVLNFSPSERIQAYNQSVAENEKVDPQTLLVENKPIQQAPIQENTTPPMEEPPIEQNSEDKFVPETLSNFKPLPENLTSEQKPLQPTRQKKPTGP